MGGRWRVTLNKSAQYIAAPAEIDLLLVLTGGIPPIRLLHV